MILLEVVGGGVLVAGCGLNISLECSLTRSVCAAGSNQGYLYYLDPGFQREGFETDDVVASRKRTSVFHAKKIDNKLKRCMLTI